MDATDMTTTMAGFTGGEPRQANFFGLYHVLAIPALSVQLSSTPKGICLLALQTGLLITEKGACHES
jgi:hypothetical protein